MQWTKDGKMIVEVMEENIQEGRGSDTEKKPTKGTEKFPTDRRPKRRTTDWDTPIEQIRQWLKESKITIGKFADTEEKQEKAGRLIYTWRDLFANDLLSLQQTDLITHRIPLLRNVEPVAEKAQMFTKAEQKWMDENFPLLEKAGVICLCSSPWSSRIKLVPKKEPGKYRMVNVFCPLNDRTDRITYPMQRQEVVLDTIFRPGFNVYFVCDGSNAYWGIPIAEEDQYKTAFNTPKGQYCMRTMGQGLTDAPFTYARFTNLVFGPIPPNNKGEGREPPLDGEHDDEGVNFSHFMDDTYGSATSFETMFNFLEHHFFPRAEWSRMSLNPVKSVFFADRITVLGFEGGEGIRPAPNKADIFKKYPVPRNPAEVEAFLYLTPYLRRFIPGRAEHAKVLKDCMRDDPTPGSTDKIFVWTEQHQQSFDAIKKAIVENSVFSVDKDLQIHLAADASATGMGGVVFQLEGKPPNTKINPGNRPNMRVIMYISRRFSDTETRYTNSEREALAVIKSLAEARYTILDSKFPIMVYTDHQALTTLLRKEAKGRIANWQNQISEYDLRIVHIPGKEMQLADGLSRIPADAMFPSIPISEEETPYQIPQIAEYDEAETWNNPGGVELTREEATANARREVEVAMAETEQMKVAKMMGIIEGMMVEQKEGDQREVLEKMAKATLELLYDQSKNKDKEKNKELDGWNQWLESEWYGPILRYKILGEVPESEENKEDKRWKRWLKLRVGRFMISELHGERKALWERMKANEGKEEKRKEGDLSRLLYKENDGNWSFCILRHEVEDILQWVHDIHGHFATPICVRRLIGKAYWPSRNKDVAAYCGSCESCQKMGPLRRNGRLPHPILQVQPMDMIGMDYLGPISPRTSSGMLYVLIVVDYFSRMVWLQPVANADSVSTAKFLNRIFSFMGYPLAVYNDGGSHFKGEVSILLETNGILQFRAPPSHPQSVGMAELVVQLVLNRLRRLHVEQGERVERDWDVFIPEIQHGLNNRYIRRFGYTPSELMFGRDQTGRSLIFGPRENWVVNNDVDVIARHIEGPIRHQKELGIVERWRDRVTTFLDQRDERRCLVTEERLKDQDEAIKKAKAKLTRPLQVGHLMLLRRHDIDAQKGKKWSEKWEGPYRISREVKKSCSFELTTIDGSYLRGRYSVDSLKPFVQREESQGKEIGPISGSHMVVIEELVGRRMFDLSVWKRGRGNW